MGNFWTWNLDFNLPESGWFSVRMRPAQRRNALSHLKMGTLSIKTYFLPTNLLVMCVHGNKQSDLRLPSYITPLGKVKFIVLISQDETPLCARILYFFFNLLWSWTYL